MSDVERLAKLEVELAVLKSTRQRLLDFLPQGAVLAALIAMLVLVFQGFAGVNASFTEVYRSFAALDERLDTVDERLDTVNKRLDTVDKRLDSMDGRLQRIESTITRSP